MMKKIEIKALLTIKIYTYEDMFILVIFDCLKLSNDNLKRFHRRQ